MKEETTRKEGTSVQAEGERKRPLKSRSRSACKARQEALARDKASGGKLAGGRVAGGKLADGNASGDKLAGGNPGADSGSQESPKRGYRKVAAAVLILAVAACVGGYIYRAAGFRNTYLPHTVINGMDVSGRTADEVKEMMASGVRDYSLGLQLRDGAKESIPGSSIGLHTVFDGSLEEIIRQQNPYAWPRYLLRGPSYDIRTMIAFDEAALEETLKGLDCFDASKVVMPADAYLSDYISGQGYTIVPETEGNELNLQLVKTAASDGVKALLPELDLEALGCYKEPSIRSGNSSLVAARDARNRYVNTAVTYHFGNRSEVLDGSTIHQWLDADGENVTLNHEKAGDYVKELASKYNTAYTKRPFNTSYGQTVELTGFYGWRINQKAETEELVKILETGENASREPVYAQTAASHDGADYGSTYAEVNLTAQHMLFYKDGKKILESDFVSGNVSRGHTTPPGIFALTYKQRDAVLKGEGYASPVKYWMPFNGGIGFHDASWRSSFGGSIYKSGGSHGCVNMPYAAAKELFENVYAGMPVICYNLPGTESAKTSKSSGTSQPPAAPQQTPAAPQEPPAVPQETPAAPQETPAVPQETPAAPQQTPEAPQQTPAPTTAPPAQPSDDISIDPVGQTPAPPAESTGKPDTTAGYGPGFQTSAQGDEKGPGVQ